MATAKKIGNSSKKKPIEQYAHKGKQRANDPKVDSCGLELRVIFQHQ